MKFLRLANTARLTIVDDEDGIKIGNSRMLARNSNGILYVTIYEPRLGTYQRLHRWLLNPPDDMDIDHANGDTFDNRRMNLRICTTQQNLANQRPQVGTSSQYKGVYWQARGWVANGKVNRKTVYLGRFKIEEDAARAYDQWARETFGEFARPNFPSGQ